MLQPDSGTLVTSHHTHPGYCDGTGTVEEIVWTAIAAGLREIGISSHAPLPFETDWTMPPARLEEYVTEVRDAQQRFGDRILVRLGAELDFIPDERVHAFQRETLGAIAFDYFIGSVHFLGGDDYPPQAFDGAEQEFQQLLHGHYRNDIRAMVVDYYQRVRQMVETKPIAIIGHLDLIKRWNMDRSYFQGDEPWYLEAVDGALDAIAASDALVELNTAGWNKGLGEPYPSPVILARCRDLSIPIVVNSDSHTPSEVTRGFARAVPYLADLGIQPVSIPGLISPHS